MSVSVEENATRPLSDGKGSISKEEIPKSPSSDSLDESLKTEDLGTSDDSKMEQRTEPSTPNPMAFTIDFGQSKEVDKTKLLELAKKSQARHQRIQSMSSSLTKSSPVAQKPPLSVMLPRKAQGYNSEGYFSSDQEDSTLSNSSKLRKSPLAQVFEKNDLPTKHIVSPINDIKPRKLKSPLVSNVMSRSDVLPSRKSLNLPLKSPSSYLKDFERTPSYGNISASYQPRRMADILDNSPDGLMLTDISSPDFDGLTPDNSIPEPRSPSIRPNRRAVSEMPDLVSNRNMLSKDKLYVDDDDVDAKSDNSSTGTYTIEDNNYTEEQKARMSIDRALAAENISNNPDDMLKDPELVFDFPQKGCESSETVNLGYRSPRKESEFSYPNKVSKEKNVLEISCCYESPNEKDLATQTSKQIKSTRSYLEKIKNRVKNITDKTFVKTPPKNYENIDQGGVTSVTTSGVLSSKSPRKIPATQRRYSLAKSEIDQTDYVHRLTRESSVPNNISRDEKLPFESTPLRNAQKLVKNYPKDDVVGQLSYLSLNRCKGDKTWIQEWADSVKKYNKDLVNDDCDEGNDLNSTFTMEDEEIEPPRRESGKKNSRHLYSNSSTPSKIPSPVGSMHLNRCTPDLIPSTQDTETYLQKTQNAITNLQAKLHSSKPNLHTFSPQLTSSLISEKALTRLPVLQTASPIPQLSRSNSLNYRLRRKVNSTDSSPLRSPGNYMVIGSSKISENTRKLLNSASRSLENRRDVLKSPESDKDVSNTSDDKTLSFKPPIQKNRHIRNHSYDNHVNLPENLTNSTISLKNVLRNNAENFYSRIDQATRNHSDQKTIIYSPNLTTTIKRSSSFNTVNKYPYLDYRKQAELNNYLSDDSDSEKTIEYPKVSSRKRIDSPDLRPPPSNTPKCSTPESKRKFGTGLVRSSVRVTNKERALNSRMSEPPIAVEERLKPTNHQSRRISEPTKQSVFSRLTKSRSSTRETQLKSQDKAPKKPIQHRSSSALASKEAELANWKKRSSYDPMRAAQEGKKKQLMAKRLETNKDDISSQSHSSPVHRSQSFHTTNMASLQLLDYSSDGTDEGENTLPIDPMTLSTLSDCVGVSNKYRDISYQPNKSEKPKRRIDIDKRKTFIIDDDHRQAIEQANRQSIDKRKTFILDSDTNSTNSPRNSSIFSHEKNCLLTCTSDEGEEWGGDCGHVTRRARGGGAPNNKHYRHSGDFSSSSPSTSTTNQQQQPKNKAPIQPRYLDISKYKNDQSNKNYLRRDPSRTYVGVLGTNDKLNQSKGSAQQLEMEQKKQELEKWKRRASYDPRKAASQGKPIKASPKTVSNVLRSQSFHGNELIKQRLEESPLRYVESYDNTSDNDF